MVSIDIADEQDALAIDVKRLKQAAAAIFAEAGIHSGSLSIAIVDDPTIHTLNRQYLDHDYPTDVLSFVLEEDQGSLEGQVIVSADTAQRTAEQLGWPAADELLLYVIHGTLHLVGYDDLDDEPREEMRAAERRHLAQFGLERREGPTAD